MWLPHTKTWQKHENKQQTHTTYWSSLFNASCVWHNFEHAGIFHFAVWKKISQIQGLTLSWSQYSLFSQYQYLNLIKPMLNSGQFSNKKPPRYRRRYGLLHWTHILCNTGHYLSWTTLIHNMVDILPITLPRLTDGTSLWYDNTLWNALTFLHRPLPLRDRIGDQYSCVCIDK